MKNEWFTSATNAPFTQMLQAIHSKSSSNEWHSYFWNEPMRDLPTSFQNNLWYKTILNVQRLWTSKITKLLRILEVVGNRNGHICMLWKSRGNISQLLYFFPLNILAILKQIYCSVTGWTHFGCLFFLWLSLVEQLSFVVF